MDASIPPGAFTIVCGTRLLRSYDHNGHQLGDASHGCVVKFMTVLSGLYADLG
jgi:hypothetical protein